MNWYKVSGVKHTFSPEEQKYIINSFYNGMSIIAIASYLHVNPQVVSGFLKDKRITPVWGIKNWKDIKKDQKLVEELEQKVIELYNKHPNLWQIEKILGIGRVTVRNILDKYHVPRKNYLEDPKIIEERSQRHKKWWEKHPENTGIQSKRMKEYWKNPENVEKARQQALKRTRHPKQIETQI
jgi:predicted transcriptional regulator